MVVSRTQFFGYWDVQGAHEEYVGALHLDDHKSGDIDEREFGWYIADSAELADYGDGRCASCGCARRLSWAAHVCERVVRASYSAVRL